MYTYHIFLIHSSVDGHVGCFHVLAVVNRAAMNMRVLVSLSRKVFVGISFVPNLNAALCFLKHQYINRFYIQPMPPVPGGGSRAMTILELR